MEGRVDTLLSLSCFTSTSLFPHLNLGVFHTGSFRNCHFPLSHAALSFLHTSSEFTIPAHCSLLFLKGYVLHLLIASFIQFMLILRFSARPFCILHAICLSHIPAMFCYLDAPLFVQNKAIIPFSFWSDLLCKTPIVITIRRFRFFHLLHYQVFRKSPLTFSCAPASIHVPHSQGDSFSPFSLPTIHEQDIGYLYQSCIYSNNAL